ncbi:hypothetical protein N8T08_009605 [Aspergillus melleus]|uniref:Uncharacterized protein n=1 Tax=Aspergillus melleus TaxID=138277 RepID=A0ACC3ATY9_9EURO|nr:hypothetical protein N8T08_009605 [Aspergillus melleus]
MTGEVPQSTKTPLWQLIFDQGAVTQPVIDHTYQGAGTDEDPFVVNRLENDPHDPMKYSAVARWLITFLVGITTMAVALISSAYTSGIVEVVTDFRVSEEVAIRGISLFVIGFAVAHWSGRLSARFTVVDISSSPVPSVPPTIECLRPPDQGTGHMAAPPDRDCCCQKCQASLIFSLAFFPAITIIITTTRSAHSFTRPTFFISVEYFATSSHGHHVGVTLKPWAAQLVYQRRPQSGNQSLQTT